MKLYFFRSQRALNFGDELNCWMWPRLLPGFFDDDEQDLFLGIGSILFDHHPSESRKIVFGAGYAGYTAMPVIDDKWAFYFVRGKLTAERFGLPASMGVGDSAILLRSCNLKRKPVRYRVSFIPHWESELRGNWQAVCEEADIHHIDPRAAVDSVLEQILSSNLILTEAMHGAIVADALRVPWIALRPLQPANRMKWDDWASALDLQIPEHRMPASNGLEYALAKVGARSKWGARFQRRNLFRDTAKSLFIASAARALRRLQSEPATLSAEASIERSHSRMLEELERLKRHAQRG